MENLRFDLNNIKQTIDFSFKWELNLDLVPQNVIEVAKLLVEKKLIEVEPDLKNGKIVMYANSVCNNGYLVDNLLEESISKNNRLVYQINPDNKFYKCNREKNNLCKFDNCPIFIAAYLYYQENKGVIKEKDIKSKQGLEFIDEISVNKNMKNILLSLISKFKKSFYCAIETPEGIDKLKIIDNINSLLFQLGKVTKPQANILTFQQFSSKPIIPKNELLVITNFNLKYGSTNIGFSEEAKHKVNKESDTLSKLEELSYYNYVILLDDKTHLDKFISLSSKIAYLFQDRIIIPEMTNEMIVSNILNNLEDRHVIDKHILEKYIKKNRKYLPFKNNDLVEYLSNFINNQDVFHLPNLLINPQKLEDYFEEIIGLENIKEELLSLRNYLFFNKDNLKKDKNFRLHMLFLGNPGTGKTTMARIITKMLFDLNYIRNDKLIEVDKKDLVAAYLGQSGIKTSQVIESALGGVLFIDEAYSLGTEDSYSKEVIATLVKAMEDYSSDLVIIFAGYNKEMQDFLNANSGIESRINYTFNFPDYSLEELMKIFDLKLKKRNVENNNYYLDNLARKEIENIFNKNKKYTTFGNGRFVDKLLQNILVKHATNCINDKNKDKLMISIDDIEIHKEIDNISNWINDNFFDFVGMDDIKDKLIELYNYLKFNNEIKQTLDTSLPIINLHMMFLGGPGTGKTTMARKISNMLYSLNYIKEDKLIEVGKQDIVGRYVGETAEKVSKLIKSALGGVLFIDEAYSLCDNSSFGQEAMAIIVKSMEDYRDNLIIIFAGYDKEMQDFLKMNSGIASRIGYTFNFKDYETEDLYSIFKLKLTNLGFTLNNVEQSVKDVCNYFKSIDGFGNGRFIDKLIQKTLIKHSVNYKELTSIDKEDIPTISEMIKESVLDEDSLIFPSDITEEDKRETAYHESGHALAQYLLENKIDIKEITIIPEGSGTLGYVLHKPNKKGCYSKEDYLNMIKRLLAGRAAEEIIYNTFYSGCSSDIEKATKYAYLMTQRLGMSNNIIPIDNKNYKSGIELQNELDKEVKNILQTCYNEVKDLLEKNKELLENLTNFMLSKNNITGEEFEEFLKYKK